VTFYWLWLLGVKGDFFGHADNTGFTFEDLGALWHINYLIDA
jgi:hypothetical protein